MFEWLACNLLQISPLKLCFEKLRFFQMCSQNAGNAISETQILKISWVVGGGDMPPSFNPLTNSCLRYSAHTFGDRIPCWGRARKMGPLAVLPHHWRILKKCTGYTAMEQCSVCTDKRDLVTMHAIHAWCYIYIYHRGQAYFSSLPGVDIHPE
jgi:hypothetical protein